MSNLGITPDRNDETVICVSEYDKQGTVYFSAGTVVYEVFKNQHKKWTDAERRAYSAKPTRTSWYQLDMRTETITFPFGRYASREQSKICDIFTLHDTKMQIVKIHDFCDNDIYLDFISKQIDEPYDLFKQWGLFSHDHVYQNDIEMRCCSKWRYHFNATRTWGVHLGPKTETSLSSLHAATLFGNDLVKNAQHLQNTDDLLTAAMKLGFQVNQEYYRTTQKQYGNLCNNFIMYNKGSSLAPHIDIHTKKDGFKHDMIATYTVKIEPLDGMLGIAVLGFSGLGKTALYSGMNIGRNEKDMILFGPPASTEHKHFVPPTAAKKIYNMQWRCWNG